MTATQRQPDARRRAVTEAEASPYLASLSLAELRAYRSSLVAEEERTSYWRRLVQARIDLLDAGGTTEDSLSIGQLARALGDTGSGRSRHALHRVRSAEPLPDLPALEDVWVVPTSGAGRLDALLRLAAAEQRLTDYRAALHDCINEATAELICRYRQDPTLALSALPV